MVKASCLNEIDDRVAQATNAASRRSARRRAKGGMMVFPCWADRWPPADNPSLNDNCLKLRRIVEVQSSKLRFQAAVRAENG
jgi:hypothetical protein